MCSCGRSRLSETLLRVLGLLLMVVGLLITLIFLPARLWLVLLGAGLIALGWLIQRMAS